MSPSRQRRATALRAAALTVLSLLLAVAFAACGTKEDKSKTAANPATLVPADALIYGEALVRPSGDVETGVLTAARRMFRVDDPGRELRRLLDEEASTPRGSFSREMEPWLGDSVGAFVLADTLAELDDPDYAVLVAVRDRDEAERAIERMVDEGDMKPGGTIDGVDYDADPHGRAIAALVDDFYVYGTTPAVRAAITASKGESLATASRFTEARAALPADRLAWGWADPKGFVSIVEALAESDPAVARAIPSNQWRQLRQLQDLGPVTMALTVRADQLVFDVASDDDEKLSAQLRGDGEVQLGDLPGDAWLAFATPVIGPYLLRALRADGEWDEMAGPFRDATGLDLDRDVLGWLGSVAGYVRGTAPLTLGGGIVLGSSDGKTSRRLLGRVQEMLSTFGAPIQPLRAGRAEGFSVRVPNLPQPIGAVAGDDRLAIGIGALDAALNPSETFADSPAGKEAIASLGDGYEPAFVLVVDPMLDLLRAVGLDEDPEFQEALPYLSAYRSVAAGMSYDDGRATMRVVVALQDPDE